MQVKDLLNANPKELITAHETTGVLTAMSQLIENRISCLLVTNDEGRLVGIISDKDIFKAVHEQPGDFSTVTVRDLMTTDVIVGVPCDELSYIAGIMTNNRVRHVPILEREKLVGLVSIGDVVKAQMEDIRFENRYLKQYIDGSYPC